MTSYAYLFKYIVIGDTGKFIAIPWYSFKNKLYLVKCFGIIIYIYTIK